MKHFDTVVVGAGVSGLTAARLLKLSGQKTVVLEARDRIGGRVHSVESEAATYDLGASWIHGIDNNPLWHATQGFKMSPREFTVGSFQPGGRPIAYYNHRGHSLDKEKTDSFVSDVETFDLHLNEVIAKSPIGAKKSYGDCVRETAKMLSHETHGWSESRLLRLEEFMQHRTEEQYGAHIDTLDAHGLDDDQVEGIEVIFPGGFWQLAENLASGLDVRLQSEVSLVRVLERGVEIHTQNEIFIADQAIVTVPVGVLQSETFTITPPLPASHQAALDNLQMNAFEKVFLSFPKRFWQGDIYAIRQQGDHGDWWHSWYDVSEEGSGHATLLTFAAGPAGFAVRDMTDKEVSRSVMTQLRRLYGHEIPEPVHTLVTRWYADDYARGSYAFSKIGADPAGHDALAEPIAGVLHLAGETTWGEDPATVTAAFMSGHRAAENVLGLMIDISSVWSIK